MITELVDTSELNELKNQDKITVVFFYASWCSNCKLMQSEYYTVSEDLKDKFNFCKVDADVLPALLKELNVEVLPTLIIIKDGKQIEKYAGVKSHAGLCEILIKYL